MHYLFLDDAEFDAWIEEGRFLEWANVHGNRYGSPKAQADAIVARRPARPAQHRRAGRGADRRGHQGVLTAAVEGGTRAASARTRHGLGGGDPRAIEDRRRRSSPARTSSTSRSSTTTAAGRRTRLRRRWHEAVPDDAAAGHVPVLAQEPDQPSVPRWAQETLPGLLPARGERATRPRSPQAGELFELDDVNAADRAQISTRAAADLLNYLNRVPPKMWEVPYESQKERRGFWESRDRQGQGRHLAVL